VRGQGNDVLSQLGRALPAAHDPNIADVAAPISLKRLDFHFIIGGNLSVPIQPHLPAVVHCVGQLNIQNARPFPVPAPPGRRMQAPEILRPPFAKMFRHLPFNFARQPRPCNPQYPSRLHKPSEIVEVKVIRPVVREGIYRYDGIEKLCGKRQ